MNINQTIAAIATPVGTGGISIIRISGENAISVADNVFKAKNKRTLKNTKSHTVVYGHIVDNGKIIDECLAAVMLAPHTFTTENTVEINCHGGITVTNEVLSVILKNGAVLADPGEFTKRAFLGGRIDLSQAEAVIDIINSPSALALQTATHQLDGALSSSINEIRDELLEILTEINALADYPEEELGEISINEIKEKLEKSQKNANILLKSADKGTILKDGINTVIIGKPNVGKSSLLNALAGENRAIVTNVAGTTRDVIGERINLGNIVLNIYDTAGIRKTNDEIESLGINKSIEYLKKASLVLFVLDSQSGITHEDIEVSGVLSEDKNVVLIANKSDLAHINDFSLLGMNRAVIHTSAKNNAGINGLKKIITDMFELGSIENDNGKIITNIRHKQALSNSTAAISSALAAIKAGMPLDMLSIDIHDAISALGEITGQTVSQEVVNNIFSRFCVGK